MNRRILIAGIVIVMLLPAGIAWFALHSEVVLHWVVARVEARYPGQFRFSEIQGSLLGPITISGLKIQEPGVVVEVHALTLTWQPMALLGSRLRITRLQATGVDARFKSRSPYKPLRLHWSRPPQLPLGVTLDSLNVNHMTLIAPQLTAPLVVDRLTLSAILNNHVWTVRSIRLKGARLHIQGQGRWKFRDGEHLLANLRWRVSLPQQPVFAGEANITGVASKMQLHASLSAPFNLKFSAGLQHPFTTPTWRGELSFRELDTQRLRPGWPALRAQGHLQLQGNPDATRVYGLINAHLQKYGDWHSHVDMLWDNRQLKVHTLDLQRARSATRFRIHGLITYVDGRLSPDLRGDWRALGLPLNGRSWLSSPRGKLEIRGHDDQAVLNLEGALAQGGSFAGRGIIDLRGQHRWRLQAHAHGFRLALHSLNKARPLPPMNWRVLAQGDARQTKIERLYCTWLSGHVQASGWINHTGNHTWQFHVQAKNINPVPIYPRFPGTLTFTAVLAGRLGTQSAWKLNVTRLRGELRKSQVRASGTLARANGNWLFHNVVVRLGQNHMWLDGRYGNHTDLHWKLDAPDLDAVWPDIDGKLVSTGHADLSGKAPIISLNFNGASLRFRDYTVGKIAAHINMPTRSETGHASLLADNVTFKDFKLETLEAQAQGSLSAHSLFAKFTTPYGTAALDGHGSFKQHVWQADLSQVTVNPQGAGQWNNTAAWQARIVGLHITLPQSCLQQGTSRACLQTDWRPDHWLIKGLLSGIPMQALKRLLPEGLGYQGSFGGTLRMQGTPTGRSFDISANLSPGAIHNIINHRTVTLLAYKAGNFTLHSNSKLTTAQLTWNLSEGGFVSIHSRINHGQKPSLSGTIKAEMHHFDLIPALVPAVGGLAGKLNINLALSGTPTDPLFNGSAALTDGAIIFPRFGLHVTDIVLHLNGNGDRLALHGQAHSGTGKLDWKGDAVRKNNVWHAHGTLQGLNFRVANLPEAVIDVSPDIELKLDNRNVQLDGTLNVPYAKLRPRDLSHTAQVSPDQVIVGSNGETPPEKWRVHAHVRVNMGGDVDLAGFGLTGRITGGVLAIDEPGHYTTGNGELQIVNGRYAAYGQKLRIDRGRLMFNGGPISNPALDIRAIRPPAHPETVLPGTNEQTVGVLVRGTLHNPKVSLFSNPPLPQAQLLTYLLTGQAPVSQSQSPLVGAPPTNTGTSLALTGGQLLVQEVGQEVGQHVGLQDVGVQNVSTGPGTSAAALFFGKYLSPRLYVSYGIGLLQPLNTLRIRYTLSTRWMLEAESGSFANSADLIYTIER